MIIGLSFSYFTRDVKDSAMPRCQEYLEFPASLGWANARATEYMDCTIYTRDQIRVQYIQYTV